MSDCSSPRFVSVIIPLYNRRELIRETLSSLRNQTDGRWECLIVDDHSDDGSFETVRDEYAAADERFRLFRRPDSLPKGACACRNYGFKQAVGDYLYFFDSDDLFEPKFIETVLREFHTKPEVDFLQVPLSLFKSNAPQKICFDKDHLPLRGLSGEKHREAILKSAPICYCTQAAVWNKNFLLSTGIVWPEETLCLQDYLFFWRIYLQYTPTSRQITGPTLVRIRQHEGNISSQVKINIAYISDALRALEAVYQMNLTLTDLRLRYAAERQVLHITGCLLYCYRGEYKFAVWRRVGSFLIFGTTWREKGSCVHFFFRFLFNLFKKALGLDSDCCGNGDMCSKS